MMKMMMCPAVVFIFLNLIIPAICYKHVIFMHGLITGKSEVTDIIRNINKTHPGTNVSFIEDFKYLSSLKPLWQQVARISPKVMQIMSEHPEGVHFLCFSQGGLICRGLLETLPQHNVINFISLSAPQAGQYGETSFLSPVLPEYAKRNVYRLFYTEKGQSALSIANYWNDPHQPMLYRKWSAFLGVINNQSTSSHSFVPEYRDGFKQIQNLILVGGPDDGVITPWQSSQFGSYNAAEEVISYTQQDFYKEDWFGLRSLDARGSVHIMTVPGVKHTHWHTNYTVFEDCILPWLT